MKTTQWCPKCKSKVALVPGAAIINPIGKLNSLGQFIPASEVKDGETVYPVHGEGVMIVVDKCPSCGYSVTSL